MECRATQQDAARGEARTWGFKRFFGALHAAPTLSSALVGIPVILS